MMLRSLSDLEQHATVGEHVHRPHPGNAREGDDAFGLQGRIEPAASRPDLEHRRADQHVAVSGLAKAFDRGSCGILGCGRVEAVPDSLQRSASPDGGVLESTRFTIRILDRKVEGIRDAHEEGSGVRRWLRTE